MHRTGELLTELFLYTGEAVKSLNISSTCCIDGFPAAVCHNIRIQHCRIVQGKEHRGYCTSQREYFFGFKVHVAVNSDGIPVEYSFTAGNAQTLMANDCPLTSHPAVNSWAIPFTLTVCLKRYSKKIISICLPLEKLIPNNRMTPAWNIGLIPKEKEWKLFFRYFQIDA